ncbi:MAG: hypothetical protein ACLQVG_11520 [Terriglobia bacterium]
MLDRISGYVLSAVLASLFYIIWFLIFLALQPGQTSLGFDLGFACMFTIIGGFGPALAVMSLPWIVAVGEYRKLRRGGQVYFAAIGAFLTFVISCATASLSPKPFFIEDQTFFEGVKIAAERQGICSILAGTIFGLSYWFLSERQGAAR